MTNFTLKFGKYKGQLFLSTPVSYQNWLLNQDWFKAPNQESVEKYEYALIENYTIHTSDISLSDAEEMLQRHKNCFPDHRWEIKKMSDVVGWEKGEGILQRSRRIAMRYGY